ncbi:MAG: DUF4258 domain-containing protein [Candidatus Diapherotrites archaeon]|nr:DUF4258 domain-containing protein [Candidatus Diapherotrites archaeon]
MIYLYVMENFARCAFRPSKHAKDNMLERGISKQEALDAIHCGSKRVFGNKILTSYRGIEVVYKQFPCNQFIITVYEKKGD